MKKLAIIVLSVFSQYAYCGYSVYNGPNTLGGKVGSDARSIKRKNTQKRAEAKKEAKEKALEKLKADNKTRNVNIDGLAGHKFGESGKDVSMQELPKPVFGRYTHETLKYSPSRGLCYVMLTTTDPIIRTEEQVYDEVNRMVALFSNRFKVSFGGKVKRYTNEQYGRGLGVTDVSNSVTGGYVGSRLTTQTVLVRPATEARYIIEEEFANCIVRVKGVYEFASQQTRVEFTVSVK